MARRWSHLLTDAIDPVLAGTPFQAVQTGEPPDGDGQPGATAVWCGGYDEVVRAYPHLADPQAGAEEGGCFDITVEVDPHGRLAEVRLEHGDLSDAFTALGRTDDAAAAAALRGRPAEEAVPELAALLGRLLGPAGG